jgi:hypothetical protein
VAYALAIVADLMLGSRVAETLGAAGHQVELVPAVAEASGLDRAEVIVADLDCEPPEALVGIGPPVLGFYQHTDVETKRAAEAAGIDLAVPRSRLVREMPELVDRLLAEPRP